MPESTSLSFRVPLEKADALEHLAKCMDRKRSWLLERALDAFLAEQARQMADIEAGLADLYAGRTVNHEIVVAWLGSWGTENELDPPR